jgi:catechol 2,3-dioxygenase
MAEDRGDRDGRRVARVLSGYADHGVSEALYLDDPDGNGVELYWDKPREQWVLDENGKPEIYTKRLNLSNLLAATL